MKSKHNPLTTSSAVVSSKSRNRLLSALTVTLCLAGAEQSMAQIAWDGGGTTENFGDGANWVGDAVPGNTLGERVFIGNVRNSPVNNLSNSPTQRSIGVMRFSNTGAAGFTNAFTVSGNLLNLTGNIITEAVTTGPAINDEISLDLNLTAGRTFNIGTSHNMLITGDIGQTAGNSGIIKSSGGTLTLSGANTFTGSMTIQQGIVNVATIADSGSSNLGLGTTMVIGNAGQTGTLNYTGTGSTTARTVRIGTNGVNSGGGATISANGANGGTGLQFAALVNPSTSVFNTTETTTAARTLTLSGSNTDENRIAGVIQNNNGANIAVTKSGVGTWTLGGANTYSGNTTVSDGKLIINGSISTSSLTTVAVGATLSGTGSVGKTVINGTLAVGNSPGKMDFTDTVGLNGSTVMEIDGTLGAGVTGGHDLVNLTGSGAAGILTYGGAMTLDIGVLFAAGAYSWDLFNMVSETNTFTTITLADQYSGNLLDTDLNGVWDLTSGSNTWQFTESTGVLGLTVVPEPRAALLGGLGLLALLRRRRI